VNQDRGVSRPDYVAVASDEFAYTAHRPGPFSDDEDIADQYIHARISRRDTYEWAQIDVAPDHESPLPKPIVDKTVPEAIYAITGIEERTERPSPDVFVFFQVSPLAVSEKEAGAVVIVECGAQNAR